jgi:DNA modification methylase
MTAIVAVGAARNVLAEVPDDSFDAVVCDPPYEYAFMGKRWDATGVAYDVDTWREILRVLKPGGHLLAFGGTRTYHRMACAIEDAGFEIRDSIHWIYGTGFPKSLDVSKAIDKAAGAATPEAAQWSSWGTALKPAHEPIVVARKPLDGTVAACVLAHGTGAINVDACRMATDNALVRPSVSKVGTDAIGPPGGAGTQVEPGGRWPPNVVFTHNSECANAACVDTCPVAELGRQSGTSVSPAKVSRGAGGQHGKLHPIGEQRDVPYHNDTGTAARFFPSFRYVAKPSTREREAGCEALPAVAAHEITGRKEGSAGQHHARAGVTGARGRRNTHPTVKPIALMRWLVRLVTPPDGCVLDPFAGSGTTGIACVLEGFDFFGIELDAHHAEIARARIAHHEAASE